MGRFRQAFWVPVPSDLWHAELHDSVASVPSDPIVHETIRIATGQDNPRTPRRGKNWADNTQLYPPYVYTTKATSVPPVAVIVFVIIVNFVFSDDGVALRKPGMARVKAVQRDPHRVL